ncbi:hypothetical protein A6A08_00475 [Nocardiopsis sp. TSRI0078]|uniref:DUF1707 domain-containing protein n=1 Tax=unclassified Nocardiopsis TaxID=2649073 RepID=UPI0009394FAD|nr:DUF1707 domain-containing protein [Nocardiopsis sp. TSRI0078]OKI23318.1 hypothetical protein A6A08_00475 [Nocardiopsis sp. TSRI0078]
MSDPVPSMRTSDAERDRVAQLLQEHFAQGRLDHEEFTDRLGRVYKARTAGELATVTGDLPERDLADVRGAGARQEEFAVAPPISLRDPALMVPWALYAGVNLLCFVIWLILFLTTDYDYPWFLWVMGPWGIVMGVVTMGVLAVQKNPSDGGGQK